MHKKTDKIKKQAQENAFCVFVYFTHKLSTHCRDLSSHTIQALAGQDKKEHRLAVPIIIWKQMSVQLHNVVKGRYTHEKHPGQNWPGFRVLFCWPVFGSSWPGRRNWLKIPNLFKFQLSCLQHSSPNNSYGSTLPFCIPPIKHP